MTILLVGDDIGICHILSIRLKSEGFQVVTAATASEAYIQLQQHKDSEDGRAIDLALIDVGIPKLPGVEICQTIKSNPETEDIPVIMITAKSDDSHLEKAFEAGAVDYISKPFKKVELMARIRCALRLKDEMAQRKRQETKLLEITRELRRANSKLAKMSAVDGLTGLFNRRYFDQVFEKEFQRATRSGRPLSLIMVDIDSFKRFNDIKGHQAGDDCLRRIAREFKSIINRPPDLIARYGGEEFALIIPETCEVGALQIADTLRRHVAALNIEHPDSPASDSVTISLGVATITPTRHCSPFDFLASADKALYRSKRTGRNRVTHASTQLAH